MNSVSVKTKKCLEFYAQLIQGKRNQIFSELFRFPKVEHNGLCGPTILLPGKACPDIRSRLSQAHSYDVFRLFLK
jgi:hypothetical protein